MKRLRHTGVLLGLVGVFAAGLSGRLSAQVLARPGWAGSGVTPESWWRGAVFYRVDPARFQASGENSTGDLAGLARRLDYLQSLGVDALVLDGEFRTEGLDDLVRQASRQHLRLLLTVTPSMQAGDRQVLLQTVHDWMSAGAAGVWLPKAGPDNNFTNGSYSSLLATLNHLVRSFPGERILLTDPVARQEGGAAVGGSGAFAAKRQRSSGGFRETRGVQLTTTAELPVQEPSPAALRQSLSAIAAGIADGNPGLLRFAGDPPTGAPDAAAAAALLLASRGAAMFSFGDEIGLDAFALVPAGRAGALPVMQWTPLNVQQASPAPIERVEGPATRPGETQFGAYHPYIHPPPRSLTGTAPAAPRAAVDGNIPDPLPAPNTLPGYTSGALPNAPIEGERINVVTEDRDPSSLLNAYRQLIALHHGNAALRGGTEVVLNRDGQNAVVWVRRAPAGSRTAKDVLAAVNLGTQPVTLSLDGDLARLAIRTGALRPLFAWSHEPMTGETTSALHLPAHAVFLGEVGRPGAAGRPGTADLGTRSRQRRP